MKILIVDDEELARARLKRMLSSLEYSDIVEAQDAQMAMELFKKDVYDTVFLDINMPKISGLELGYELKYHNPNVSIVFQTAYDEHALKAFDIGAVAYLVKPFSIEQLQGSLERIKVPQDKEKDLRLLTKMGDNYLLLKPEEVHYIKADLTEVMIRSSKGFSYYSQKISQLSQRLEAYDFVRIHRSYIINVNEIKEIETIEQSKLRFSFKNNSDSIESSKDGAKLFRDKFSV